MRMRPFGTDVPAREVRDRIKAWTRKRFTLPTDATVSVAEMACGLPGCPPRETVVAFWTDGETRHQFKVFKPLDAVIEDDVPPAWLKPALASDGLSPDCC